MYQKIKYSVLLLVSATGIVNNSCTKGEMKKPNILLILADDMGYSDLGCYGSEISTPNLDKLAENGTRFSRFYNGARCCPSRASLLTGLYPHQTGLGYMTDNKTPEPGYQGEISSRCVTIAEALKPYDYHTYMAGKWHVANSGDSADKHNWPLQRGFDHFFGTIRGGGNYFRPNGLLRNNTFIKPDTGFYYTFRIAEEIASFIHRHAGESGKEPFFMYAAFTAPHWPLHAPDSLIRKQKGKYDWGWDQLRKDRLDKMTHLGLLPDVRELSERDPLIPDWEDITDSEKEWFIRRMEVYAAQIEALDMGVGMILNALEEEAYLENTLVIFLSDNGGCAEELGPGWKNFLTRLAGDTLDSKGNPIIFCNQPGIMPGPENTMQSVGRNWAMAQNTPFRLYKHYVHEGGISTPLIMHWPLGIRTRGEIRHQAGGLMDIMATVLDAAGAEYPAVHKGEEIIPAEGHSLLPIARKNLPSEHDYLFWEHEGNRAVQHTNWKLVSTGLEGKWELYDINKDRIESIDLSGQFPEVVRELEEQWSIWAFRTHVLPKPE